LNITIGTSISLYILRKPMTPRKSAKCK